MDLILKKPSKHYVKRVEEEDDEESVRSSTTRIKKSANNKKKELDNFQEHSNIVNLLILEIKLKLIIKYFESKKFN